MPAISLTFSNKSKLLLKKMYDEVNEWYGEPILQYKTLLEPHITLLLTKFNEEEEKIIRVAIDKIVQKYKSIEIQIEGIGIFQKGSNRLNLHFNVAYGDLMQIHKEVWKELGKKINIVEKEHYFYTSFIPHISVPVRKKVNNKTAILKIQNQLLKYDLKQLILNADHLSYIYGNLEKPMVYHKNKLLK